MAGRNLECTHQSSGACQNDVRKIESSAKTNDPVLPEEFGCRVNSKGIVPSWVAGCVARVLHRSEKHHNVRARSSNAESRQDHGNLLNRTDANDECPSQRCTTSEQ